MSHTTTQKAAPAPVPTGASAWEWEKGWCQEPDLNWRPSHFQCDALPTELSWQRYANKKVRTYVTENILNYL